MMVKHRMNNQEWWCLPGGGVKPGETAQEGALRELEEECCVAGEIRRETAHYDNGNSDDTITFLVEIGSREPRMGVDPEFERENQILADMQWLTLAELEERYVHEVLEAVGGNMSRAAEILGIDRRTLYRKVENR